MDDTMVSPRVCMYCKHSTNIQKTDLVYKCSAGKKVGASGNPGEVVMWQISRYMDMECSLFEREPFEPTKRYDGRKHDH